MQLSIIIVSYNVKYFVEQCLLSIYRSEGIPPDEFEVLVIDNFSADHSVPYLRQQFPAADYPQLHLIANKRNVGFGKANNQALKQAKGKYILFLNPDTLLTEHTLADVLRFAETKPDLVALGAHMLQTNGHFALESRRGMPTPWVSFCRMSGLGTLFPHSRLFGRYYLSFLPIGQPHAIDIVSGAFMMVPHRALQQNGGFDEDFFMYGEDIDLSYRLLQQGLQNYYCPTLMLHYKGESTKKNTYRYVHVFYQAMLLFFNKHFKHYGPLLSLPVQLAILLRGLLALAAQQRLSILRFLHPRRSQTPGRMLYLGHATQQIQQIATAYGLDIDCRKPDTQTAHPDFLTDMPDLGKYQHVVYDMHDFAFDTMLRQFSRKRNKQTHIGTFNPNTGILITGSQTYTLFPVS